MIAHLAYCASLYAIMQGSSRFCTRSMECRVREIEVWARTARIWTTEDVVEGIAPNVVGRTWKKRGLCMSLCSHQSQSKMHEAGVAGIARRALRLCCLVAYWRPPFTIPALAFTLLSPLPFLALYFWKRGIIQGLSTSCMLGKENPCYQASSKTKLYNCIDRRQGQALTQFIRFFFGSKREK